jgi:transposase
MERLHMNEIRELIYRFRRGEGNRTLARELKLSRNTVRKYRALAQQHSFLNLERDLPSLQELAAALIPPLPPRQSRSTVEAYEEVVGDLLRQNLEKQAIWQRLQQDHGYTGSYSSVCRFVNRIRPAVPEVVCRIETAAGEEAQVDFGYAGLQWDRQRGKWRKAWMFVMVLSHSRHQYVEFVFDQKIATWLSCHEHAFTWFGGVPRKVVLDNLKSAVLQADLHDPVLGEPYRRLAQHYGFILSPNRVATPRHKGKVESGVHYLKRNFLAGQTFADLQSLNDRARQWVMETAGQRIHGTTQEAP